MIYLSIPQRLCLVKLNTTDRQARHNLGTSATTLHSKAEEVEDSRLDLHGGSSTSAWSEFAIGTLPLPPPPLPRPKLIAKHTTTKPLSYKQHYHHHYPTLQAEGEDPPVSKQRGKTLPS